MLAKLQRPLFVRCLLVHERTRHQNRQAVCSRSTGGVLVVVVLVVVAVAVEVVKIVAVAVGSSSSNSTGSSSRSSSSSRVVEM